MLNWYGDELKKKTGRAVKWAMNVVLARCVKDAKAIVPKDMAVLQGSIQMREPRKTSTGWVGLWGSWNCGYAIFVELGTAPHIAPIGPLKDWARRKFGDEKIAYAVRAKIAVAGTKERPYLRPTADRVYPMLKPLIRQGMRAA